MGFFNRKMNVRLAAQTLSESVADAIDFCADNEIPGFEDSIATTKFIRYFNRLFDIFNEISLLPFTTFYWCLNVICHYVFICVERV